MYSVPYHLQYHLRFLLASTVENKDTFHQYKVREGGKERVRGGREREILRVEGGRKREILGWRQGGVGKNNWEKGESKREKVQSGKNLRKQGVLPSVQGEGEREGKERVRGGRKREILGGGRKREIWGGGRERGVGKKNWDEGGGERES